MRFPKLPPLFDDEPTSLKDDFLAFIGLLIWMPAIYYGLLILIAMFGDIQ